MSFPVDCGGTWVVAMVLGECLWTVTWVSFAAAVFAVTGGWLLSWVLMASGYSCAFVWRPVALVGGVLGFGH